MQPVLQTLFAKKKNHVDVCQRPRCGYVVSSEMDKNCKIEMDEKVKREGIFVFLAVQNSSIGDLVRPLVRPSDQTNNQSLHSTTVATE